MIEELRIRNLGVIESAKITFTPGMTAVTGETGAGKTMTVTALQLLMGAKADAGRVRAGAESADVEGIFLVPADSPAVAIVRESGGSVDSADDGMASVIVARHVPATGRSRAYLGGRAVPASVLDTLASHLVTVHGQTDQQRLTSTAQQRAAVDEYGGAPLAQARHAYEAEWAKYQQAQNELQQFEQKVAANATERMAMQMLVTRVEAVKPLEGEDEQLKAEARRLDNVESLHQAMQTALAALSSDNIGAAGAGAEAGAGALELLAQASHELERTGDPELAALAHNLANASAVISDVRNELGMHAEALQADPQRLEAIHARRAQLRALERELGLSVTQMLAAAAQARTALANLADPQAHLAALEKARDEARAAARAAADTLMAQRQAAAHELATAVNHELADLYMKDATFQVRISPRAELSASGGDEIEFALAPHAGAQLMPLGRAASGGEISRIMLAIEVSLAQRLAEAEQTFIFDEIDAGIGGKSALAVGERLAKLAAHSQVLTVTHLAQVAAYANSHVVVKKESDAQGAVTQVVKVQGEAREIELARMLSGHTESQAARTHALELLRGANVAR